LRLRDGVPLLDPDASEGVAGWLLWFDPERITSAWSVVCSFEPPAQYKWAVTEALSGQHEVTANVLAGKKLDAGTAPEMARS
jgi:predicted component of type VI protein secretion system